MNDLANELVSALARLHLEAQLAQNDRQELIKYATAVGLLCDQVDSQFWRSLCHAPHSTDNGKASKTPQTAAHAYRG